MEGLCILSDLIQAQDCMDEIKMDLKDLEPSSSDPQKDQHFRRGERTGPADLPAARPKIHGETDHRNKD